MTTVESMFTFQTNCTDAFTNDKMEPFAGFCRMSFESRIWQCSHQPRKCPTGLLCGPSHAPVPQPVTHAGWWFRTAQLGEPQNSRRWDPTVCSSLCLLPALATFYRLIMLFLPCSAAPRLVDRPLCFSIHR